MLSNTPLRTYQSVQDSVAKKFSANPQYSYSAFVHDTLTPPELVCWLLDELYVHFEMQKPYLWYQHFVIEGGIVPNMVPVIHSVLATAGPDFTDCILRMFVMIPTSIDLHSSELALALWNTHVESFVKMREVVVSRWPENLDPMTTPLPPLFERQVTVQKEDSEPWFPNVTIELLPYIEVNGALRVIDCRDMVVHILWEHGAAVSVISEVIEKLSVNDTAVFLKNLETVLIVQHDAAYVAYQDFITQSAPPVWVKNFGIIQLAENMSDQVLEYYNVIGERYLDYRQLPSGIKTVSEALRTGARTDPGAMLFLASQVTGDDMPNIEQAAAILPVYFFGENSLLQ